MINPEDEILIDLRTSCTKDEAAAKMLGWMQGNIHSKYIKVTEDGISGDQLPFLQSLEGSLQDQLQELHEAARNALLDAAEANLSDEIIQERVAAITRCNALTQNAGAYLAAIEDELAKGEASGLRIDRQATDETGEIHITIKSLDDWANTKYGISIIDPSPKYEIDNSSNQQKGLEENGKGLSNVKAQNLYTSFAFLVEAFAQIATGFKHEDDSPNVKAISERIAKLSETANKGQQLAGQSTHAIKKRIEEAAKIKRSILPNK